MVQNKAERLRFSLHGSLREFSHTMNWLLVAQHSDSIDITAGDRDARLPFTCSVTSVTSLLFLVISSSLLSVFHLIILEILC